MENFKIYYIMLDYLPFGLKSALSNIDMNKLFEIRLRSRQAVTVNIGGKLYYLSEKGASNDILKALTVDKTEIDEIMNNLTKRSLYAYADKIRRGFITGDDGERVGVAGECVTENENITAIKNFTSLNIRIPHIVTGAAKPVMDKILSNGIHNILIFSKPSMGKTTIIRDLVMSLSKSGRLKNILVVDERDEIINNKTVISGVDVMKNSTKKYCFINGIRSLNPDIIVTDEIYGEGDYAAVKSAIDAGVNVIATAHGTNVLKFTPYIFDYYVKLDDFKVGQVGKIYKRTGEDIKEC